MKVIVAGSRGIDDISVVSEAIEYALQRKCISEIEIVSGTARGVDRLGELWASIHGVPVKRFPANWDLHGRRAGYLRNAEMAEYADGLIAIWDGYSRGTKHMIDLAKEKGLKVYVSRVSGE
jgi:hypothetical protein